jgi:hypothetical protein
MNDTKPENPIDGLLVSFSKSSIRTDDNVAFVSEFQDDRRFFRQIDTAGREASMQVGGLGPFG